MRRKNADKSETGHNSTGALYAHAVSGRLLDKMLKACTNVLFSRTCKRICVALAHDNNPVTLYRDLPGNTGQVANGGRDDNGDLADHF